MNKTFLQAALMEPPVVLGRQLLPFCPGHLAALEALESPVLFKNAELSPDDLGMGVFVCSMTYEENKALLHHPEVFISKYKKWAALKPVRKLCFDDELEEFRQYIEDSFLVPEHAETKNSIQLKAPPVWRLVASALIAGQGAISLSEAWNMGIPQIACLSATVSNINGDESLISEYEEMLIQMSRDGTNRKPRTDKPKKKGRS